MDTITLAELDSVSGKLGKARANLRVVEIMARVAAKYTAGEHEREAFRNIAALAEAALRDTD